jgi:hypothetical protein
MFLDFKPPARPHAVQIAIPVELQQIGRVMTGTTRHLGLDTNESDP